MHLVFFYFTDFRFYMNENFPIVLESFYKLGEFTNKESIERLRTIDEAVFEQYRKKAK